MNTSRITSIFATRARKFGKRMQKTRTSTHLCTGMYTVHVTKHFELTCIYSNDAFRVDASVKLLMQMVNFWNIWAIKSVMWIYIVYTLKCRSGPLISNRILDSHASICLLIKIQEMKNRFESVHGMLFCCCCQFIVPTGTVRYFYRIYNFDQIKVKF